MIGSAGARCACGWVGLEGWSQVKYEKATTLILDSTPPSCTSHCRGGGFPRRWCWVQCNTFAGSLGTSLTAVGAQRGLLGVPGVEELVGLIGIHHQGKFYEFLPNNGTVGCLPPLPFPPMGRRRWSTAELGKEMAGHCLRRQQLALCAPWCMRRWSGRRSHGAVGEWLRATQCTRRWWRPRARCRARRCALPPRTQGSRRSAGTLSQDG